MGKGKGPRLKGAEFQVSKLAALAESVISMGFSKTSTTIDAGLPLLQGMVHRVRKCRMLGSAALDLAYVACGRLDAYIEQGISLWDIAAGWLRVEAAGGRGGVKERGDLADKFRRGDSHGVWDLR